jgi:hypothetical protein
VGVRHQPGSSGRLPGGQTEQLSGLDAIAQYGIGERDPLTGLYEAYDIPEGHAAQGGAEEGHPVTWTQLVEQWELIVADFTSEYGIDLRARRHTMPWRDFAIWAQGLMTADTRIARHFRRQPAGEVAGNDG